MPKETATPVEIKISASTILKIVAVLFVLWLLYFIRDIISMVIVALIFAAVINPMVDWFEKKKVPRPVSVIIIYIIFFSALALIISLLVPPLIREIKELASNFSYLWAKIAFSFVSFKEYNGTISAFPQAIEKSLSALESALTRTISGVFSTIADISGGLISFIAILVITFYLVIQGGALKKMFYNLIPEKHLPFTADLLSEMQKKISLWLRGQLILCFVVGLAAYIGLTILGVNYALALGIFAGITEIIPYAGPFIAGVLAVLFALAQSPFTAFMVVILYVFIQQAENNLLVPKIMQKAVGLNPIVIIIALLVGFRLAGILGGLFAIPIATAIDVAVRGILKKSWSSG